MTGPSHSPSTIQDGDQAMEDNNDCSEFEIGERFLTRT